jgi:Uma2 family endonuclease
MQTYTETALPAARPARSSEPAQCVVLHGISWETYERLLTEHEESSGTHFTYDRGRLEIMVLSAKHEAVKHVLALLVEVLAEELNIDVYGLGSTTFRRADLERGFEPDACFYIQREALVRGKDEIDLTVDPPPDLVIEIDITSPSLNKFPIFAALGIPEIWRYDGARVSFFGREGDEYIERAESALLPNVTSDVLTEFVEKDKHLKRTAWLRYVREWARQLSREEGPGC